MKRILAILLLWSGWGFTLGTLVLIGPLRWIVEWSHRQHWTEGEEKIRVYLLILLLAVISFFAARATATYVWNREKSKLRFFWVLPPLLGTLLSVYAFMHPKWMAPGKEESIGGLFTIGPYPGTDKLEALKNSNYTTIISLLHPAVVPFEPKLLKEEQTGARELGLQVVSIPMLPWISDNTAALDSLRKVVRSASGKVYVHCYLGKDRVNIARRIIEQEARGTSADGQSFGFRSLDTVKRLERGPVFQLEKNVFFSPFPTREEYVGYVLAANFNQVISLVDFREPGALDLMEVEKQTLEKMKIPFKVYDFSADMNPDIIKNIITEIKALPKPQLIHPFFSDAAEANLFLKLYQ